MLVLLTLSFLVVVHPSAGTDDLSGLLKKYPTWSFELQSVETLIKDVAPSLKSLHPKLTEAMLRAKISATLGPNTTHIVRKTGDPKWLKKLPSSFDLRDKWKACANLMSTLEDEGPCHTDGPAVAASVTADRYCIFTNGTFKERLSQEMLAGCAESCTKFPKIWWSFQYITQYGIPTGGPYKSSQGCVPYVQAPCIHDDTFYLGNAKDVAKTAAKVKPCSEEIVYDHFCPTECSNSKYSKTLDEDRKKLTAWYRTSTHEWVIRNDMILYGPVSTHIVLFDDFFKNPEGMYWTTADSEFVAWEKHLKLVGWGVENGTKYWRAINTWDKWGATKEFKIPRGRNYLYVELFPTTGVFEDIDHPNH